jgi:hypothetical protein
MPLVVLIRDLGARTPVAERQARVRFQLVMRNWGNTR